MPGWRALVLAALVTGCTAAPLRLAGRAPGALPAAGEREAIADAVARKSRPDNRSYALRAIVATADDRFVFFTADKRLTWWGGVIPDSRTTVAGVYDRTTDEVTLQEDRAADEARRQRFLETQR